MTWGGGRLRRLAQRVSPLPAAIILAYHRVADVERDPQLLCVSPGNFAAHLDILRQYYHPLSLSELRRRLRLNKWLSRTVVVTFDDGYADNLHFAKPCLEATDVPATVFVTAGRMGSSQEFWWDELEAVFLSGSPIPHDFNLQINGQTTSWRVGDERASIMSNPSWHVLLGGELTPRQALYLALAGRIRDLPPATRESTMKAIFDWAGKEQRTGRPTHRALNADEVQELAKGGLIEVGAHTVSHSVLSSLSLDLQDREIADSKHLLEECLGLPVTSFSYPFGGRTDYTPRTVRLVKNAGFTCACSNFEGRVSFLTDPYQLPRFLVRNWDGEEFGRMVNSWFMREKA